MISETEKDIKKVYEEYSADRKSRFFVCDEGSFYSVRVEYYYPENEIEGYVEPAGFREVSDDMVHHVGNIDEGIKVGQELLRNI